MELSSDFTRRYEKLPVSIFSDSADASQLVADKILLSIRDKAHSGKNCVLALSASSTCTGVYDELVKAHKAGQSFKNVVIFSLDEFYPLGRNEVQSHYRFLKEYLFDLVDILPEHIHCFDSSIDEGKVRDHCEEYERLIRKSGGIDIMVLSNMGFNEPGSHQNSHTRPITLNYSSRINASSDFFGVEYVPHHGLTMGIDTILSARKIFYMAWGEGKAPSIKEMVEGEITDRQPSSFLQNHSDIEIYIDEAASAELTRIKSPWMTGDCEWTDYMTKKAVFWLCKKLNKPILKLTARDYNDNGMSDLITRKGPASDLNINIFNELQHTISGWPGGKPNADDSTRPERALPYPKRVVVFSPHPDDDVISMGGTVARLSKQGHIVNMAYETSGNIAVFDHDVIRFLDFLNEATALYGGDVKAVRAIYDKVVNELKGKHPGDPDPKDVLELKAAIRRGEATSACRYLGIPDERVHFLNLPFYETGGIKKKPLGKKDVAIVKALLESIKPHQIFAAGDLSDPHGTHRVCLMAVLEALKELKKEKADWLKDCRVWLYRGAWQEWDVAEANMAVPLSPEEVNIKREAIFRHQSQKDRPRFPGSDAREFWLRAEERNHNTAEIFDRLGMAEYQAIELFVRYNY